MKIKIEIDCTPSEARAFMGLPDVEPLQTAVMDKLQTTMMDSVEQLSPEKLMQTWFDPKMATRLQDMFANMAGLATGRAAGGKK
jgi:hypothetical protein